LLANPLQQNICGHLDSEIIDSPLQMEDRPMGGLCFNDVVVLGVIEAIDFFFKKKLLSNV
jgi:hypothetical protein